MQISSSKVVLLAFAAVVFALLAVVAEARPSAAEDGLEDGEMNGALKYLEQLDKYYSQVARPR